MSASSRTLSTFSLGRGPAAPSLCIPPEPLTPDLTQLTDRSPLLGSAGLLFAGQSTPPATSPPNTVLTSPISTFSTSVISLPRTPVRTVNRLPASQSPPPPVFTMSSTAPTQGGEGETQGAQAGNQQIRQRSSPLNSVYWLALELFVTLAQIISSIVVLSVSTDERPKVPLGLWIIGYASGCFATLPILHWRYAHRRTRTRQSGGSQVRQRQMQDQETSVVQGQDAAQLPAPAPDANNNSGVSSSLQFPSSDAGSARTRNRQSPTDPVIQQGATAVPASSLATETVVDLGAVQPTRTRRFDDTSWTLFIERLKICLDCFFAVWFVTGNVWLFGGNASAHDAPNQYRLCIVFLTFSCLGYAMPFILCATICLLLPCIALMGFVDEPMTGRGASKEVITSFPTYKFKALGSVKSKRLTRQSSTSDSEGEADRTARGGILAAGTPSERPVAAEDALCCICLGQYKDGDELRELPCTHHFHSSCVDQWLKINASCPLCKSDMIGGADPSAMESGQRPTTVASQTDPERRDAINPVEELV
ncbi:hypothetical protein KFL_002550100 [Klebsormidium nitens]|uniref:RING-type domain-containing protein n=1 Tax=Klebsormidium nitens TaxID=105231 RepID=A0A1Y1I5N2_KLENI|nr:hypothetical protein KFL_002550100 [Klebsormidium nitens]|eukprot:GAQ85803.1 hypothetical protein KFL_002550100 [Klebsormidium nitens]